MRTNKQVLGDIGEAFVAEELGNAGFTVELIGGNFPGYDILANHPIAGTGIRVQVKTWSEGKTDSYLAKVSKLHRADVYVLVRADDLENLRPYVFLADEIAEARPISETPSSFPFTRDPGVKNPTGVKFWARRNWQFCQDDRLAAWHLIRASQIGPASSLIEHERQHANDRPNIIPTQEIAKAMREERNGVRAPKPGGLCYQAWGVCDELLKSLGRVPMRAEVIEVGATRDLNRGNIAIEYQNWKKFHGLSASRPAGRESALSTIKSLVLSKFAKAEPPMPVEIDPFHAISIGALAYELAAQGQSVIHMEYGQPSTGAPSAAIAAVHRVLDADPMGYWESPGLMERIAAHYREEHGVEIAPEQVMLTCGASPALVLALNTLFAPGDRVALARPGYVAYRNTLKALWMEPVEVDCGEAERFQLTAAAIAALDPAPAGIIVASPANPTGTVIADSEMVEIAEVCRDRGIRIVSDEIYHGIVYGERVRSVLCHEPQALVINSFSKYFSMAGWRLGWLVVPPDLVEPARARMGNLFLTPPSLAQHAGLAAFDCREELEGHIETYARNRALMLEALPKLGLRRIAPPDGAFYIYADVGHLTNDSLSFCKRLLRETGIATAPGVDFDPANGNRFIRFSFAVSTAEVQEALDRLERWLKSQPHLNEQEG